MIKDCNSVNKHLNNKLTLNNFKKTVVTLKEGNTILLDKKKLKIKLKLDNSNKTFEIENIRIKLKRTNSIAKPLQSPIYQ